MKSINWDFENKFILEDLNEIVKDTDIPWDSLDGDSVLVTGATGLIGSLIVKALLFSNIKCKVGIVVRDLSKARTVFGELIDNLEIENIDVSKSEWNLHNSYSYIVHAASSTSSQSFIKNPVEVIDTIVNGTSNLLKYCKSNPVKSFVFLSTLEVYGYNDSSVCHEEDSFSLNQLSVRNSYPVAKRLAENLCISYFTEYNVPTKIIRLTQTIGPGLLWSDERVCAQFCKCVVNNQNIVLRSKGETERDYLYTADAVKGILAVLCKANSGTAFNLSNPDSYASILDLANLCKKLSKNAIDIIFDIDEEKSNKYLGEVHIHLDNSKIRSIVNYDMMPLDRMFCRLIDYYRSIKL